MSRCCSTKVHWLRRRCETRRSAASKRRCASVSSYLSWLFFMKVPPEIWFAPVGRCIYCRRSGAELNAAGENAKLSPEHIIPFSFGGHWVLPEASCQTCADITGAIEGKCCNMMLRAFRVHADVPTRRKKKRPTHLIVLDGETPHSASCCLTLFWGKLRSPLTTLAERFRCRVSR
jgi:hypothetical protein